MSLCTMYKMHIDEVEEVVIELERHLQSSFVPYYTCHASRYIGDLLILHERDMLHFYEANQEHLPHDNRVDCHEVVLTQVVCKFNDNRHLLSHLSFLASKDYQVIKMRLLEELAHLEYLLLPVHVESNNKDSQLSTSSNIH